MNPNLLEQIISLSIQQDMTMFKNWILVCSGSEKLAVNALLSYLRNCKLFECRQPVDNRRRKDPRFGFCHTYSGVRVKAKPVDEFFGKIFKFRIWHWQNRKNNCPEDFSELIVNCTLLEFLHILAHIPQLQLVAKHFVRELVTWHTRLRNSDQFLLSGTRYTFIKASFASMVFYQRAVARFSQTMIEQRRLKNEQIYQKRWLKSCRKMLRRNLEPYQVPKVLHNIRMIQFVKEQEPKFPPGFFSKVLTNLSDPIISII